MAKEATRVVADLRIPIEKIANGWADKISQSHCRHCLFLRFLVRRASGLPSLPKNTCSSAYAAVTDASRIAFDSHEL